MAQSSKDDVSFLGIPMKYVSLLLLVLQTVSVVATMRYSRSTAVAGPRYLNTVAVYLSEVMKLAGSAVALLYEEGSLASTVQQIKMHVLGKPSEMLKVCVPGLLYTLQNNLLFVALSNLSGAVYQVSYQLKILTTAVLSVIILRRSLGYDKWAALLILTSGVALIQWPRGDGKHEEHSSSQSHADNTWVGMVAVGLACVTSGFAGVYLEKILKQTSTSIWIRNIQLALFGSVMGLGGALWQDGPQIRESGMMQGFNRMVWMVIMLQAIGGLVVAAVLKYADNILKCFGNALSIILSCMLSAVVMKDFEPDLLFVAGTVLVLVATSLYSLGVPEWLLKAVRPSRKNSELAV